MILRAIACLVLLCSLVRAATGDILSVAVETNGWQALITISGLNTNGTYAFGLGDSNTLSAPKLALTVSSAGFDDSGVSNRVSRTVYGTKRVRKPYPDNAAADESVSGGNVTIRVALSDFIHPDCTATADLLSGLYTQGTASAAASGVSVSNNSTLAHSKVVGNWSMVNHQQVTSSTLYLKAVAFHRFGQQGRPVRMVRFIAADESGDSVTNTVTAMSATLETASTNVVLEYIGTLDISTLTQGDVLTCQFQAYPWIGDSTSILNTADGVNTQPTPLYAPLTLLNDRTGAYGVTVAVVDSASGVDATGVASTSALDTNSPPASFLTIAGAAHAIAGTNNTVYSRNDVGGGIIYLKTGNHNFTGASTTYGNTPETWVTITRYPGLAQTDAVIHAQTGNSDISDRVRIYGVKIDSPTTHTFDNMTALWFDTCYIDSASGNNFWIQDINALYVTGNTINSWGDPASSAAGIRPPAGATTVPVLIRGNAMIGTMRQILTYTALGNTFGGPITATLSFRMEKKSFSGHPQPDGAILAYNKILRWSNANSTFTAAVADADTIHYTHGAAIVQNLFENVGSGTGGIMWAGADDSTNTVNNVIAWNNTLAGQRENWGYNDNGSASYPRNNWSLKNHLSYKDATKDDLFTPADGGRLGQWPVSWGVGNWGVFDPELAGVSGAGSFLHEFMGINSYQYPTGGGLSGNTNWFKFTTPLCFDGVVTNVGGGNYHLQSSSPVYNIAGSWVLPYDIEGNARGVNDPPGAYAVSHTYYVSTNGDDSAAGTLAAPFRTIQHGVDVSVAGDTVIALDGDYNEEVVTKASGTSSAPITVRAQNARAARIKEFRFNNNHQWNVLDGMAMSKWTGLNQAGIRIESSAHNSVITNCLVGPATYVVGTGFSFGTNSMTSQAVDFNAAGFVAGGQVWLGASGLVGHWYTNHDTARTVLSNSVDGHTIYFTGTPLATDPGTNYWAFVFPGGNNNGTDGIIAVQGSGISCATNVLIANTKIQETVLAGFRGVLDAATMRSCLITNIKSGYGLVWNGRNSLIESNLVINDLNVLWYTQAEIASLTHPEGGTWFDYQVAHINGYNTDSATNNIFRRNWIQNIQNQLSQIEKYNTNGGFQISSNVFVGVAAHGSISRNEVVIRNNTFYKTAYDQANIEGQALAIGGVGTNIQTGLEISNNVWLAIGSHSNTNQEGSFTVVASTNAAIGNNFAARNEILGYNALTWAASSNWYVINGGDPLLVNPLVPLGPDGLPFTADDGLRPLPGSPIALAGLGALEPATVAANSPKAHFKITSPLGWKDSTGTNYNMAWATNSPYGRAGMLRDWTVPETAGTVPCFARFNAEGSYTNSAAMVSWTWDFGDGSAITTYVPEAWHTYCSTGSWYVSLTVTNSAGNVDSVTNIYRTLAADAAFTNVIWHVATNGNDTTGTGTQAAPYRTIAKARSVVNGGDYVAVHSGIYDEDVDCNRNVGSSASRVTFIGYGARSVRWDIRHPFYTFDGFEMTWGTSSFSHAFYLYEAADSTWIVNNNIHDYRSNQWYGVYYALPASVSPLDGQLNCVISNNIFDQVHYVNIGVHGSNTVVLNNRISNTEGEGDAFRLWGMNHRVAGNYITNLFSSTGGHCDFLQSFGDQGYWLVDVLVESNIVVNSLAQICQLEMNSTSTNYTYTNRTSFTNLVLRNNIFANMAFAANVDSDGTKWYNNLFYRCNSTNAGHVFSFAGPKGSAYGTVIQNNTFFECGTNVPTSSSAGWYSRMADQSITNLDLTADYNLVYPTKQTAPPHNGFRWGFDGTEANGVNGGDPLFVDADGLDFRLLTNSACIDAGVTISGFSVDLLGVTRPIGAAWDIGPYEGSSTAEAGGDATPPEPDPMTFAVVPFATGPTSISMTGSTATDVDSPPVEYYFDETSGNPGGTDSGWQSSATYTDTGLSASTQYTYRVKARDSATTPNETAYSGSENATTNAESTAPVAPRRATALHGGIL